MSPAKLAPVLLVLMASASPWAAAEPRLEGAWYRIELILFERAAPERTEDAPLERLAQDGEARGQPARELALRFPYRAMPLRYGVSERQRIYGLSEEQIAGLALPESRPQFDAVLGRVFDFDPTEETEEMAREEPPIDPSPELVPREPEPDPAQARREALAEALEAFEDDLRRDAYRPLASSELVLAREASRLRASGEHEVVWHGAWHQSVPPRDEPLPVLFRAGPRLADRWRYEGTIAVARGRFLHLHAGIWREIGEGDDASGEGRDARRYQHIDEHRRMRSEELHYLDHPRFGLLVRIDEVALPDHIERLAEANDAEEE